MVKATIDRIAGIVRSNVNELLDQIEDPEKMVRQMIRDMDEAVDVAVATMCTAVANQRRLEREHADNTAKAAEFQQKAERAVAAGDDELGRLYLERKTQCARTTEDVGSALDESRRTADELRDNLQSLRAKLQDARNRQGTLVARCQAARARGLNGKSSSTMAADPFASFGQLEQRIAEHEGEFERLKQQIEFSDAASQAEAEVRRELEGTSGAADRKLQDLETQRRVADELEKLRAKVGQKAERDESAAESGS